MTNLSKELESHSSGISWHDGSDSNSERKNSTNVKQKGKESSAGSKQGRSTRPARG